ncbi:AMP-binding protein [bacterium]|nr:AMP-binding protein [bacterium]
MIVELSEPTIRQLFERSLSLFSQRDALSFVGESPMTYHTLGMEVIALSRQLLDMGIHPGDRIAILGSNSPNWVIAYFSVTIINAVAVPILPGFPEGDVHHILRESECKAIFVSEKYHTMIEDAPLPDLKNVISLDELTLSKQKSKSLGKKVRFMLNKSRKDRLSLEALPKPAAKDLAVIIYTSGTTGFSKGVILTHQNIISNVINGVEKFPIVKEDKFLSILPLSHTFEATGGMLCPLSVGASIVYMDGLPTPQKLLNAMQTAHPTAVLTVPLVVDKIYRRRILPKIQKNPVTGALYKIPVTRKILHKAAGRKLIQTLGGQLRFFMFGGAALNEDVEIFLRDAGISYSTGYGMTETSPILTINPFGRVRMGSCGQAIPNVDIRIDNPHPETGIGEIVVTGPNIMQGYYNNPEATRSIFTEDGWLKTGDLGFLDNERYLYIKGRSKNVIVGPSGENIYPEIIEQLFLKSPVIQEIVVYQDNNQLVAKVYLEKDYMESAYHFTSMTESEMQNKKLEILELVRHEYNDRLPVFSRLSVLIEYPEPFEKTPTNKVKRYLYIPETRK